MKGAGTHNAVSLLNETGKIYTVYVTLLLWIKALDKAREKDMQKQKKKDGFNKIMNKAFSLALSPAVQDLFPKGNVAFL